MEEKQKRKQKPAVLIRVSEEELRHMEKVATAYGETVQKLFRKFVNGLTIPKVVLHPEGAQSLLVAINRIGNNINQIARRMNEGNARGWYHEFNQAKDELGEIRNLLRAQLGNC